MTLKNSKRNLSNKAQVFTLDFFIGLFAFIALLVIGFTQLFTMIPNVGFEQLHKDATYISTVLIDSGYPLDWNETSVILPGIADGHKVNVSKLDHFENLSYVNSKLLLHITSEYLFFFRNKTSNLNLSSCVYGYPVDINESSCEPVMSTVLYKDLIKTERLLVYNGSIITMVVYSWKR